MLNSLDVVAESWPYTCCWMEVLFRGRQGHKVPRKQNEAHTGSGINDGLFWCGWKCCSLVWILRKGELQNAILREHQHLYQNSCDYLQVTFKIKFVDVPVQKKGGTGHQTLTLVSSHSHLHIPFQLHLVLWSWEVKCRRLSEAGALFMRLWGSHLCWGDFFSVVCLFSCSCKKNLSPMLCK